MRTRTKSLRNDIESMRSYLLGEGFKGNSVNSNLRFLQMELQNGATESTIIQGPITYVFCFKGNEVIARKMNARNYEKWMASNAKKASKRKKQ